MGQEHFLHHYLVFVDGLLLFVMAVYAFVMPRGFARSFGWSWDALGVFGACYGLYNWGEVTALHFHYPVMDISNAMLMAVAFVALFEFGRRALKAQQSGLGSPWIYVLPLSLGLAVWVGLAGKVSVIDARFWKYALVIPGAAMASVAMLLSARSIKAGQGVASRMSRVRQGLFLMMILLALFGIKVFSDVLPGVLSLSHLQSHLGGSVLIFVMLFAMTIIHGQFIFYRPEHLWKGFWGKHRGFIYLLLLVPSLTAGFFVVGSLSQRGIAIDSRELHVSSEVISERINNDARVIRALVQTLALSPNLTTLSQGDLPRVNATLDRYAKVLDGSICYALDLKGNAVASSNRDTKDSFVGNNYTVRPYFKQALADGFGEYTAMGLTSRVPGFYTSAALHAPDGQVIGVVVIKAPLGANLLKNATGGQAMLVHASGVILAASSPDLVFKGLWPMEDSQRQELIKSKQVPVPVDHAAMLPGRPNVNVIDQWQDSEALFHVQPSGLSGMEIVTVRRPHDLYIWQMWGFGGLLFVFVVVFLFILWNEFMQRNRIMMQERERRLAEQKAQMEVIFNSSQVGLLLVDSGFRVKRINQVVLDMGGQELGFVIGRQPGDALSCIQAKEAPGGCGGTDECNDCPVRSTAKMILKTGEAVRGAELSRIIRTATGEHKEVWLEVNATPLDIGAERHILFSLADVTARRFADREVRESATRLDMALQASKMGTWRLDIRTDRRFWDAQTHRVMGTDMKVFKGTADEFFRVIHSEDREKVRTSLAEALKTGVYDTEYRVIWPDGTVRVLRTRGKVFYENGKPAEVAGVIWDITEQKRVEEEQGRRTRELEVFYKASIGREERILELKKEVERLSKELGKKA
ncbi:MAG: PAS domain-containing protein [Candidatus Omnitrophota bacterium]